MPCLRFLDGPLARRLPRFCDMARRQEKAFVSARMARIRSSGSKLEREFAAQLRRAGIRFRRQYRVLGRPDFVILKPRIAIFCDSRFWHGYHWSRQAAGAFRANASFWIRKIEGNRQRDKIVSRELRKKGWKVIRFWEHQLSLNPARCILRIQATIDRQGAGR